MMSRKDSVYPKHVKLKIDPKNPPADLFERGSRRCVKCGTQWPNYSIFTPSPCCEGASQNIATPPHMTWEESSRLLLHARFERYYEKWNDDVTDEAIIYDESIKAEIAIDPELLAQGLEEIEVIIGNKQMSTEI